MKAIIPSIEMLVSISIFSVFFMFFVSRIITLNNVIAGQANQESVMVSEQSRIQQAIYAIEEYNMNFSEAINLLNSTLTPSGYEFVLTSSTTEPTTNANSINRVLVIDGKIYYLSTQYGVANEIAI